MVNEVPSIVVRKNEQCPVGDLRSYHIYNTPLYKTSQFKTELKTEPNLKHNWQVYKFHIGEKSLPFQSILHLWLRNTFINSKLNKAGEDGCKMSIFQK